MNTLTDEDISDFVFNCMSSEEVCAIVNEHLDIVDLWAVLKESILENPNVRKAFEEEVVCWKKQHGFEDYSELDFKKEMWKYET